uniref:rRNA methyltransferase 1, mitochondrial n=1 Tax=Caenorhabditis japonica TaxID=281687 RepID=A0A8R1E8I2_CAEJA
MAKKSVDNYMKKKIEIPGLQGEALFGLHSVLEAARAGKREFHAIYLKKAVEKRAENNQRIAEILTKFDELGVKKTLLSDDQLDRLTEFQLHNGICVDASPLKFSDFDPKTAAIFVDKVLDPGNLGAIGRSAWYFGADGIGFSKGRGPKAITPSMSKSSCGALEHLPVQQFEGFHEFREKIKMNGGEIVATCDPHAAQKAGITVKTLNEWTCSKPVGIVLGDEGVGISKDVLNLCDNVISISPVRQDASNVTSLNVSVVAGILLHHISLQNRTN